MKAKMVLSVVALALLLLSRGSRAQDVPYELKTELPDLPRGVREAGDIELSPDKSIPDIKIPGFQKRAMSRGRIYFRRDILIEKASTLDDAGARKLAESFIDDHFPKVATRKAFFSLGRRMRSSIVEGKETKPEVQGYMLKYAVSHKAIPILNDMIGVSIKGDEIESVNVCVHGVREVSKPARLLTARECLARALKHFPPPRKGAGKIIIYRAAFGYQGGFTQRWQERRQRNDGEAPFRARPVYSFGVQRWSNDRVYQHVFDARTGELIYPKPEAAPVEVSMPGPTIGFSGMDVRKLLLVAPRDVMIRTAVMELETSPVSAKWIVYSVKEIFSKTGEWGFSSRTRAEATYLTLNGNQDRTSTATGAFVVDSPGTYEIQMLVFQGRPNSPGRSVSVAIDEETKVLGTKGPNTAHLWESLGTIRLSKGEHRVSVVPAPQSLGYWEVGPLRLRPAVGACESGVKDLRVVFGRSDRPHYTAAAPTGRFETPDLVSSVSYALRYQAAQSVKGRNIAPVTISSASAGELRIRALRLSLVGGSEKETREKASQFLLVGPNGETSREIAPGDIEALSGYLEHVEKAAASTRHGRPSVCEALRLCGIIGKLARGSSGLASRRIASNCKTGLTRLAREEAELFALIFRAYSCDRPRPGDFPKGWAGLLDSYRAGLDGSRVTGEGGYLDAWGNPYSVSYGNGRIRVVSLGPNGRDDGGEKDDIVATSECRWK